MLRPRARRAAAMTASPPLRADDCVMNSAPQRESDRQGLDTVSGGDLILEPFYIIMQLIGSPPGGPTVS